MAMISSLPENLQALFAPRPPLDYIPVPERKKREPYTGFSAYSSYFEDPEKTTDLSKDDLLHVENREQKKERIQRQRNQKQEKAIREQLQECNYHQKVLNRFVLI